MSGSARNPSVKSPFDLWLKKQLQTMYDDIAQEPLPDDLVVLTEQPRGSQAGKASPRGGTPKA